MNITDSILLDTSHSLFSVSENDFLRFNELVVEQFEILNNDINKNSVENVNFYYIFRDLWFYFDSNQTLKLKDEAEYPTSKIRYTYMNQILTFLSSYPLKKQLLDLAFNRFLLSKMVTDAILSAYESFAIYNHKLNSAFSELSKFASILNSSDFSLDTTQESIQYEIISQEVVNEINAVYNENKFSILKKLEATCTSWQQIVQTSMIFDGENDFKQTTFSEQMAIYEKLMKHQNLIEVAEKAEEFTAYLESNFIHSIIDDFNEFNINGHVEKRAPIVICLANTNVMYRNRILVNGIILGMARIARRLQRGLYILPYSSGNNHVYYFENGQFTIDDFIMIENEKEFGMHHYSEALNLATLFLRDDMVLKRGRLIFIADDQFNEANMLTSSEWKNAFKSFKAEQQLIITTVTIDSKIKNFEKPWFSDQMVYVYTNEPIPKITTIVK